MPPSNPPPTNELPDQESQSDQKQSETEGSREPTVSGEGVNEITEVPHIDFENDVENQTNEQIPASRVRSISKSFDKLNKSPDPNREKPNTGSFLKPNASNDNDKKTENDDTDLTNKDGDKQEGNALNNGDPNKESSETPAGGSPNVAPPSEKELNASIPPGANATT